MNNILKIIIVLIVFLIMPVVLAYIIVKLFLNGQGTILGIIFIVLIVLEIIAAIFKCIKYNKEKKAGK